MLSRANNVQVFRPIKIAALLGLALATTFCGNDGAGGGTILPGGGLSLPDCSDGQWLGGGPDNSFVCVTLESAPLSFPNCSDTQVLNAVDGALVCVEQGVCEPPVTCTDMKKNGNETDVDCGGSCPTKCGNTKACTKLEDCTSKYCSAGVCADAPPCDNKMKDGNETDIDCGGANCGKCNDGRVCTTGTDCTSTFCEKGQCVGQVSCANGVKDNDETDVDCGGSSCKPCAHKQACAKDADCVTKNCEATLLTDGGAGLACGCKLGDALCGGECVDLTTDKNNCSKCDNACSLAFCQNAACSATCTLPSMNCNGKCVHLDTDENCGACGVKCTASETCSQGVCTAKKNITDKGCADGSREAFGDKTMFPDIAGCAGAWTVPGIFPYSLRTNKVAACATNGNSMEAPGPGTDCSAGDLCAEGWHICRGGEIGPRTGNASCSGLTNAEFSSGFYSAAISGPGCLVCATLSGGNVSSACTSLSCVVGCRERDDLSNDLFGCGLSTAQSANCEVVASSNDQCSALDTSIWKCPDSANEGKVVTKTSSSKGGVLCCR